MPETKADSPSLTDSSVLETCEEIAALLEETYGYTREMSTSAIATYWDNSSPEKDASFGNRTHAQWSQILHSHYLKTHPDLQEAIRLPVITTKTILEAFLKTIKRLSSSTQQERDRIERLRATEPFQSEWNDALNRLRAGDRFIEDEFIQSESEVFRLARERIGDEDLAAHIADDIALVLHAAKQGSEDPLPAALLDSYFRSEVPTSFSRIK